MIVFIKSYFVLPLDKLLMSLLRLAFSLLEEEEFIVVESFSLFKFIKREELYISLLNILKNNFLFFLSIKKFLIISLSSFFIFS